MSFTKEIEDKIAEVKREIREGQCPYFEDDDFYYYLKKNNEDVRSTIYEMLLIKAEDSTISVSGLSTSDTSGYFRRLASRFKKFNSCILSEN